MRDTLYDTRTQLSLKCIELETILLKEKDAEIKIQLNEGKEKGKDKDKKGVERECIMTWTITSFTVHWEQSQ